MWIYCNLFLVQTFEWYIAVLPSILTMNKQFKSILNCVNGFSVWYDHNKAISWLIRWFLSGVKPLSVSLNERVSHRQRRHHLSQQKLDPWRKRNHSSLWTNTDPNRAAALGLSKLTTTADRAHCKHDTFTHGQINRYKFDLLCLQHMQIQFPWYGG